MSSGLFFIIEEEKGVKYNNIDIDEAKLSYFKIHNLSYHKKHTMAEKKHQGNKYDDEDYEQTS